MNIDFALFCSVYSAATCDNPQCRSLSSTKTATAMVIDPCYAARIADKPPPLYLCDACTPVSISVNIDFLIASFLSSCYEKATEALYIGRIQTCLGVSDFSN